MDPKNLSILGSGKQRQVFEETLLWVPLKFLVQKIEQLCTESEDIIREFPKFWVGSPGVAKAI
jgi:hypothetical protein